uniref:Uncharacterized protein n=1 Tax=Rhizophora mucronata TaxID=61149 RepID=A0A2P2QF08_RHIMU
MCNNQPQLPLLDEHRNLLLNFF